MLTAAARDPGTDFESALGPEGIGIADLETAPISCAICLGGCSGDRRRETMVDCTVGLRGLVVS